jgi:hypothetical protein
MLDALNNLKTLKHHSGVKMENAQQTENLKQFIEEQLWLTKAIAQENQLNLETVRSLRNPTQEALQVTYWLLIDLMQVIEGKM